MTKTYPRVIMFYLTFLSTFLYGQCPPSIADVSALFGGGIPAGTGIGIVNGTCNSGVLGTSLGTPITINGEPFSSTGACDGSGREVYSAAGMPVGMPSTYTIEFDVSIGTCIYGASGNLLAPEIMVSSTNDIVDGSGVTQTSIMNGTDFGSICATTGTMDFTYTIANTGTGDLNLTGTPNAVTMTGSFTDFSITQPATTTLSSGFSTTFTVTFNPISIGEKTATIIIPNNDDDENPFNFVIKGIGIDPSVSVNAVTSTVSEDSGNLVYRFTRDCGNGDLTVNYSVSTTGSNSDFSVDDFSPNITYNSMNQTGTVKFTGTNTIIDLIIAPQDDNIVEASETITITVTP